jgi:hypothetical protein
MTTKNTEAASLSFQSDKEIARREFHDRRELETNEHDFAFLDGFDAGYAAAKEEAWHPILSEDDLPPSNHEKQILWRYRNSGTFSVQAYCNHGIKSPEFMVGMYSHWKEINYTEPQTGGKDD